MRSFSSVPTPGRRIRRSPYLEECLANRQAPGEPLPQAGPRRQRPSARPGSKHSPHRTERTPRTPPSSSESPPFAAPSRQSSSLASTIGVRSQGSAGCTQATSPFFLCFEGFFELRLPLRWRQTQANRIDQDLAASEEFSDSLQGCFSSILALFTREQYCSEQRHGVYFLVLHMELGSKLAIEATCLAKQQCMLLSRNPLSKQHSLQKAPPAPKGACSKTVTKHAFFLTPHDHCPGRISYGGITEAQTRSAFDRPYLRPVPEAVWVEPSIDE